jgi:hypothetical protein
MTGMSKHSCATLAAAVALLFGPAGASAQTAQGPQILALKTLQTDVNVRTGIGIPMFEMRFATGPSGLNSVQITLTSPSGAQTLPVSLQEGLAPSQGAVEIGSTQLSIWSEPGAWSVTGLVATDWVGNITTLSAPQIAALKPAPVMVANPGPADTKAPIVSAGTILTPTVSLSTPGAQIGLTLVVADNASGIANAAVLIDGTGGFFALPNISPELILSGTIGLSAPARAYPAGSYTIVSVIVCDHANNCLREFNAAQIAAWFGGKTSFTITN